jgi:transcriptional regulator with XRE-family HTH domain
MKISAALTDYSLLQALGERLARLRVEQNLTQAALASQAGVSKRSIERLESGQAAAQLSGFLRVCRALGVLDRFELLLPEPGLSPIEQLKHRATRRQRVRARTAAAKGAKRWSWGEPG